MAHPGQEARFGAVRPLRFVLRSHEMARKKLQLGAVPFQLLPAEILLRFETATFGHVARDRGVAYRRAGDGIAQDAGLSLDPDLAALGVDHAVEHVALLGLAREQPLHDRFQHRPVLRDHALQQVLT